MVNNSYTQASIAGQVKGLHVPYGHLALWALGQQGYLIKGGSRVIIIDPYLSNYVEELTPNAPGEFARLVPIVIRPEELDMVDLALATHHHADHCDPHTLVPLLQASPHARLVASYTCRDLLVGLGVDPQRITAPPIGQAVDYGEELAITAIPSAHYGFEPDAFGNPAFLGYIISMNGVTLYHAGDTVIYDGLIEHLKQRQIDIVCLPINGRDWFREREDLVGNMDYREAAELTVTVGADVLLPGHNDMFKGNKINPAYLLDYLSTHHPQQRVHFLRGGELYYYVLDKKPSSLL